MAMGDIGIFLPSETQYASPGAYDTLLRAEATKRAEYLSSMDQFYAELEESQRQFDETLGFQKEQSELSAQLTREGYASQETIAANELEYKREALAAETDLAQQRIDLEAESLDSDSTSQQLDWLDDYLFGQATTAGTTSGVSSNSSSGSRGVSFFTSAGEVTKEEYDEAMLEEDYY